jgi:hypothetical protein
MNLQIKDDFQDFSFKKQIKPSPLKQEAETSSLNFQIKDNYWEETIE